MNHSSHPLISVIIPNYNQSKFLPLALDSVISQSFNNWEVLIIDNHSSDETDEVIKPYLSEKISLLKINNYGIIGASRNLGIEHSKGDLIAFLDSDDFWYPEKLKCCLQKLSQGYDLVCHAEVWVGPGKRRRNMYYGPEARATYESLLLNGNSISTSAVVVRREWLKWVGSFSVQSEYVTAEDYDLWLKLSRNGARIGFIEAVLGEYLIHGSNQSRAGLRNSKAVMAVFENHRKMLEGSFSPSQLRRREALILYSGGRALQNIGHYWKAWPHFFKAVFRYPWEPRFYVAILFNVLRLKWI